MFTPEQSENEDESTDDDSDESARDAKSSVKQAFKDNLITPFDKPKTKVQSNKAINKPEHDEHTEHCEQSEQSEQSEQLSNCSKAKIKTSFILSKECPFEFIDWDKEVVAVKQGYGPISKLPLNSFKSVMIYLYDKDKDIFTAQEIIEWNEFLGITVPLFDALTESYCIYKGWSYISDNHDRQILPF